MPGLPKYPKICTVCGAEYKVHKMYLATSVYCSRLCQNRTQAATALASRRRNAMAKRGSVEQPDHYKLIPLGKGINALVDNDLFDVLNADIWRRETPSENNEPDTGAGNG